jgi:tRNA1Val (adenine37-N6)-methyltransferase
VELSDTVDTALGGKVSIVQPKKGYRFSVDAVLLARFASSLPGESIVDLGCGSGVVGLCMLKLSLGRKLLGVDIQQDFIDRANHAKELNGFGDDATFRVADISNRSELGRGGVADIVVSNPPYRQVGEGRISPDPSVAIARHEIKATLVDVVGAAAHLLKRGGVFCAVYPAFRLDELLVTCRELGLMPQTLRMVHSTPDGNATIALLSADKGGKAPLTVSPPLILHPCTDNGNKYSDEAIRLLGGEDIFDV